MKRSATPRRARAWVRLADEELLKVRLCDLNLTVEDSRLGRPLRRLYSELAGRGIEFKPHAWLAEEWFSPDGVPGIAVPFYLAHPRLERLERRMMHQVEGGNMRWLMRILRHEAGHALDNAYRLRRRASWRETFGPASLPYPERYRARPAVVAMCIIWATGMPRRIPPRISPRLSRCGSNPIQTGVAPMRSGRRSRNCVAWMN
ncbi:MAG: hypothetical protein WDM77_12480 [Steroidobacteraceae bacterium]